MDKLSQIFTKQRELQQVVTGGVPQFGGDDSGGPILFKAVFLWQQYVNQQLLAIFEETVEVMKETAYKNPDATVFGYKASQAANLERMKEEIVDLLHFFVNLCMAAGMNEDELLERYLAKNRVNVERQKEGY